MKRSSLMKEEDMEASGCGEKVRKELRRACALAKQLEEQVKGPWICDHHVRLKLSRKALDAAATFHNAAMLLHSAAPEIETHAPQSTKHTPSSSPTSSSDNMSEQGINSSKVSNPHDQDHSTSFENLKRRKLMPKFTVRMPCIALDPGCEMPPDDGHVWRKYGQKDILGSRHPRCYYRCTHKNDTGCRAVKHVQRSDDPNYFNVTYQGCHNCTPPSQSQNLLDFASQSPLPPFSSAIDFWGEFQLDLHPAPTSASTAPLFFTTNTTPATTEGGISHLKDASAFSASHLQFPLIAPVLSSDTLLDSSCMASFTSSTIASDPTQELINEDHEDPWEDRSIYHELEKHLPLIDRYDMYEDVGFRVSSSLAQNAADHPQIVERPSKEQPSAAEAEVMNAIGYPNYAEPFFLLFPDDNLARREDQIHHHGQSLGFL